MLALSLLVMTEKDWTIVDKPYDLRERLFLFACVVVRVSQFLHTRGPIAIVLSAQLLRCGTSAGANYEEADDGSSPRDTRAKRQIVLRELKETSFRLRVLRRTGILLPAHDPVIGECSELVKIMAALIRNSRPE
jgi:four helix bundle protein